MNPIDYDLVIAGAGLAGGTLALAAAQQGLRVALLDPCPAEAPPDARYLALAWDNCRYLAQLGLWVGLAPQAAPVRQVEVTQQGSFGTLWLGSTDLAIEALGYVVPAAALNQALHQSLVTAGVAYFPSAQVLQAHGGAGQANAIVALEGRRTTWTTRLVVAADGADSRLRTQAHRSLTQRDYCQSAIIAGVTLERQLQGVAYERLLRIGALALLPTPVAHQATVIWSTTTAEAEALSALEDAAWLQRLAACLGTRVTLTGVTTARRSYPLTFRWAPLQAQQRLLLLGNAAHTLHPFAAQGFNLILRDIAALTRLLTGAGDPGDPDLLARYQAARRLPQAATLGITDLLARGVVWPWTAPLRGALLGGLALLPQQHWLATVAGAPPSQVFG